MEVGALTVRDVLSLVYGTCEQQDLRDERTDASPSKSPMHLDEFSFHSRRPASANTTSKCESESESVFVRRVSAPLL